MKTSNLDETFNTDVSVIKTEIKNLPVVKLEGNDEKKEYVQDTYVDLIEKGKSLLGKALEQVGGYDTVQFELKDVGAIANLINALTYANDKLNTSLATPKEAPSVVNNTQHNTVIATTEEILDSINNRTPKEVK